LQSYSFVLKHRFMKSSKVVDALSWRIPLLNINLVEVVSQNCLKTLYEEDAYFSKDWKECKEPWSLEKTPYLGGFFFFKSTIVYSQKFHTVESH
jgi:hypothetical protein